MFYSITGQVVYTDATSVAVSCGGVAFNCSATANTLKNIGTIGDIYDFSLSLSSSTTL